MITIDNESVKVYAKSIVFDLNGEGDIAARLCLEAVALGE